MGPILSLPTKVCATAVALTLALALISGDAAAQSSGLQNFFDNITGSLNPGNRSARSVPSPATTAQAQPATPSANAPPLPWSGEDGASGHPLMTASAIREAAANFDNCVASMWPDAARRGVSQQNFQRFTAGLSPDLRIMDLMDSQPEFTKAIWEYLDILVNDNRMAKGREILAKYKPQFDAVEKAYGVDRYIIASIWGIESNYSTQMGDRSVLNSTATLACVGRRQKYFKDEFLVTLEILNRGDLRPDQMRGSWAGAFGPTQFMPTAFKRYAVDADGDGRRDVVDNPYDLIASTANNLKKDGWQPGSTWGYEVVVPTGFNYMLADRARAMTVIAMGASRAQARDRSAVSASRRQSISARAGWRRGSGLPDAAELPRHHEIQPRRSLRAGDRAFCGPPARRRAFCAAVAAAGTGIVAHRAAGIAATPGAARLLSRHAGRPARRHDARGAARLPGLDRRAGGWICVIRTAGSAAGKVILSNRARSLRLTSGALRVHFKRMIFCAAHINMKNRARFGAGDVRAR